MHDGAIRLALLILLLSGFSNAEERVDCEELGLSIKLRGQRDDVNFEILKSNAKIVVSNKEQLLRALSNASTGDVVYVYDNAEISLSGFNTLVVPQGVTLISGWSQSGTEGALLKIDIRNKDGGIQLQKDTKLSGFRIRGPDSSVGAKRWRSILQGLDKELPRARGVSVHARNVVIENCEIYHWPTAAITLWEGGDNALIRGNYIHHNQREGWGYGVEINKSLEVLLEGNIFQFNRHSVAATGAPRTGYEAKFNRVLSGSNNINSHAFDMHGWRDSKNGSVVAGEYLRIHHNIINEDRFPAVRLRGRSKMPSSVNDNCFGHVNQQRAISHANWDGKRDVQIEGNLRAFGNTYLGRDLNSRSRKEP